MRAIAILLLCSMVRFGGIGQAQDSQFSPAQHPPTLRCGKARLMSRNGQAVVNDFVKLTWLQVDWGKGPHPDPRGMSIRWKLFRKLKTDVRGELVLPKLKEGTYQLELATQQWASSGMFEVQKEWQPVNCTQEFVLKD